MLLLYEKLSIKSVCFLKIMEPGKDREHLLALKGMLFSLSGKSLVTEHPHGTWQSMNEVFTE